MRFKYYLRGCGLGILLASVILTVAFCRNDSSSMSDADVMKRASELGMIMPDSSGAADGTEDPDALGTSLDTEAGANPTMNPDDGSGNRDDSENGSGGKPDGNNSDPDKSDDENSENNSEDPDKNHLDQRDSEKDDSEENSSEKDDSKKDESGKKDSEDEPETVTVVVKRGEVCRELAEDLYEKGLIPDADEFREYMKDSGYDDMILVGEYELSFGMEYQEIAKIITTKPE